MRKIVKPIDEKRVARESRDARLKAETPSNPTNREIVALLKDLIEEVRELKKTL